MLSTACFLSLETELSGPGTDKELISTPIYLKKQFTGQQKVFVCEGKPDELCHIDLWCVQRWNMISRGSVHGLNL